MGFKDIIKKICACIVLMSLTVFTGCIAKGENGSDVTGKTPQHTKEAKQVLAKLRKAARRKAPLFGHQDALMYGQNWWINERDSLYERSDVYEVCGEYPYVLGLDLGKIEEGGDRNIDRCLFKQMKEAAIAHHNRGGLITISWHMDNPETKGTSWDCTGGNVVHKILVDSLFRQQFLTWLDAGAGFLNSLVDSKGHKIPVLFRPWHECNMDGFWWSGKSCTEEEFIKLWRFTFDYFMNKKKMYQLLWVYSPHDIKSRDELVSRYPGDEFIDVIGYERYQLGAITYKMGAKRFAEGVSKGLDMTINFSQKHKKIAAFTETGFTGIPYDNWWTEALGTAVNKKRIAYVLVWRNGKSESYFFGPCMKSSSSPDFKKMVKDQKIKLLSPR